MQPAPPFSCRFSPNLPELLWQLNCTVALSTYQAGKVVFISPKNEDELVQLPRTFKNAMAIGIDGRKLAIASDGTVVVMTNEPALAKGYPNQPDTYDGIFMPRVTYYTGHLDIHGLAWGEKGLWAVNTVFSCLCLIDEDYSFKPQWQPGFISKLAPEDRCHLNGMAVKEGSPLWVTALGKGDDTKSWRKEITTGGVIIHVPTNEIIAGELPMPHTPRLYDGRLYLLFSATGEIVIFDTEKGTHETVNKIPGFIRGMSRCGDYLFIGQSKIRKNASAFKDLKIAKDATESGFTVLHLPTGSIVAELKYQASVDEIYDIEVIPGFRRPGIINTEKDTPKMALSLPETTFWVLNNNKQVPPSDQEKD